MKSLKQYSVAVAAIALAFGGVWYYTQNSYSYHLEKAKVALVELKDVLAGKPAQTALIPSAFAEEAVPVINEAVVTQLATTVVQETEKAIDIAETKTDPMVVQQALAEISVVQDQTVPVLADATVAVTTAEATQKISIALQITTTDQSILQKAQEFVAQATLNGDTQVAIDIQTSSDDEEDKKDSKDEDGKDGDKKDEEKTDEQKATEAKANLEAAKALVEELKTAKVDQEDIDKILKKIEKAEEALKDGKMGRAYGLSTAALAQAKHLLKEAKEEDKKEEEKSKDEEKKGDEDKDEDKGDEEKNKDGEKSKEEDKRREGRKDEDRKGDEDKDEDKGDEEAVKPALPLVPRLNIEKEGSELKSDRSSDDRDGEKSERDDD
ncbi:hypothetical protein HZA44_04315 [Candidatus Peregrinibacteria bacterium]|nr:hypothetical protein [Candidatus Peregrinibacteria bacterium]